ncbi:hypothetical protein JL720_15872 [Aureococcus anophagefferens]|nr:hypothetical protein JL720_15872 [Aureococcus anophagefferens]
MEHFAAATLPQYEELWRGRTGVDHVVLPQVAAASNFASARGADTDWFKEAARFRTAQHSGVLVGAHGASLTNGVFQRDGAALLEVLNCGHRSNTYRKLATNRGLFYASATKAGQGPGGADCGRDLGRRHAGTSFCKLAARNKCAAPPKFSTMWDPGDGPTWGNCARGLKVVHESASKIGKGRRGAQRRSSTARSGGLQDARLRADGRRALGRRRRRRLPVAGVQQEALWCGRFCGSRSRVASHHNHLWTKTLRTAPKAVKGRTRSSRKPGLYFKASSRGGPAPCVDPEELPFSVGAPHRTGYDWSMRPPGAAATGQDALLDFAVVLVVEQASRARNVVRHGLGWRPFSKAGVFPTIGATSKSRKVVAANATGSDRALLTQHNQLDLALYAFANDLFDADVFYDKAALAASSETMPTRGASSAASTRRRRPSTRPRATTRPTAAARIRP